LEALRTASELAAPQGYVRPFHDEANALDGLLRLAAKRDPGSLFLRKLLVGTAAESAVVAGHPDLIEALSDRELDVLRLLRGDLSGRNTVRTHTKNIYEKLDVSGRRAAVSRAEAMNLFARDSR
jgi:LuxR family maltose regulon positive regulatory protein